MLVLCMTLQSGTPRGICAFPTIIRLQIGISCSIVLRSHQHR